MESVIEKVTCFVVNPQKQVAVFQHPHAGIQIPAGTVEIDEPPQAAALREAEEETGLSDLRVIRLLGTEDFTMPPDALITKDQAIVYARPDAGSFDWARLRRGIRVKREREQDGFIQVTYLEPDQDTNPHYITYQITGWVRNTSLTSTLRRYFFLLQTESVAAGSWPVNTDHHTFTAFWANPADLQRINPHQIHWLKYLPEGAW